MRAVRRLAALLLLALSAFQAAYALSPLLASQCACDHPADVPCDCPHHQGGQEMPCHRHHHAMKAAAQEKGCALKNHCGAKPPPLLLATQAPVPSPILQPSTVRVLEPRPVPSLRPVRRSLPPERRPPRVAV